jgi:kynurenine 3-monooxygenase
MRNVVVVGGGLAGLAVSALLSKSGFAVTVAEARPKTAQEDGETLRSINLALSARGILTLGGLGLQYDAMRSAVRLYGRRIHLANGSEDFQPYDLVGRKAIYSIRRAQLWKLLCGAAESSGVALRFGARLVGVDRHTRTAIIADRDGQESSLFYDVLIGSDGAHSAVRQMLVQERLVVEETHAIRHAYLELSIPRERAVGLERHALHIWPRNDQMLVALPNTDGSFTASLFLPEDHARSTDALMCVFHREFPDITSLIPDLPATLAQRPIGRLFTSKCRPWSDGEAVLLLGDAAHTMAPFYGQGMNCALEDCWLLMRSVKHLFGNWQRILEHFECNRRGDADAITILSQANYNEMSQSVVDSEFKVRREIERVLQVRFPTIFVPLYAMIAFSNMPYAEAMDRGVAQDRIVDRLADGLSRNANLDLEAAWLKTALAGLGTVRTNIWTQPESELDAI